MKKIFFVFIITSLFISCKSDKQKIEEAKQVVETFVRDLELENYISANKIYPSFSKIGKYWILYGFHITDTKIDKETVTIYGTYKQFNTETETIMFVLITSEDDGKYLIEKTKGLSSYFGSDEYQFFKNIGCLRGIETDEEIAKACKSRIKKYDYLVANLKNEIEKSINDQMQFIKDQTEYFGNKKQYWKIVYNYSSTFSIPGDSYEIDMLEVYWNDDRSLKSTGNYVPINNVGTLYPNTSMNLSLSNPPEYQTSYPRFKITDTKFIEKFMGSKSDWTIDCISLDKLPN